ncbi:TlpA family protein disulfide reductase [Lysobacter sp. A378]
MTRTSVVVLLVAVLLASLLVACQPAGDPATESAVAPPSPESTAAAPDSPGMEVTAPGQTAPLPDAAHVPVLQVTTIDGDPYDLADHRGKWVVVNFWATWCRPCLEEMPELSALDAMREHVEVIGLAYEDIKPADLKAFLLEHPVVYPISIVDTYDPPVGFDTPRGLPMTYLIAPDGSVAKKILGPVTANEIEAVIAAAT